MAEDEDEYDPAFPTGDDDEETVEIENVPKMCCDDVPLIVSDEVVVDASPIAMKIEEISTDQELIVDSQPIIEIVHEQIEIVQSEVESETVVADFSSDMEQESCVPIDDVTIDADGRSSQDVIAEEILVTTEEEPVKEDEKMSGEPSLSLDFTSDSNCSSETWKSGVTNGEMCASPSPKDEEDSNSNSSPSKKSPPSVAPVKVKRSRGRPAGSTKTQHANSGSGNNSAQSSEGQEEEKNGKGQTRRRSSRIKSIEERKERQRELKENEVKKKCEWEDKLKKEKMADPLRKDEERKETSTHNSAAEDGVFQPPCAPANGSASPRLGKESPATGSAEEIFSRPEKVKSRWRRSSELERAETKTYPMSLSGLPNGFVNSGLETPVCDMEKLRINSSTLKIDECEKDDEKDKEKEKVKAPVTPDKMPAFDEITANIYRCDRKKSKSKKEVRRMVCDCTIMKEEISRGMVACGEDCLNRLLMIECGSRCQTGGYCSNKRFQKQIYAKIEPFKTEMKGWGLRALEDLPGGTFLIEYVGEVLESREFRKRVKEYARDNHQHYYFMALKSDEIIDATRMGNPSRFINHSCSPNCETQKWTVNGELRIGFFTRIFVAAGEELTFDYQFQRYGKEAQRCYCQSDLCRGYIGGSNNKQMPIKKEKQQREQIPRRKKIYEERRKESLEDMALEEEVERLNQKGGLKNREHTLTLSRLMVRAEDPELRMALLKILQKTTEQACLRLFLDYHGLSLLWSWMADVSNDEEAVDLKTQILQTLQILPINNKTMLMDSKVLAVVQKWAELSASQPEDHNKKEKETETETQTQIQMQTETETHAEKEANETNDSTSTSDATLVECKKEKEPEPEPEPETQPQPQPQLQPEPEMLKDDVVIKMEVDDAKSEVVLEKETNDEMCQIEEVVDTSCELVEPTVEEKMEVDVEVVPVPEEASEVVVVAAVEEAKNEVVEEVKSEEIKSEEKPVKVEVEEETKVDEEEKREKVVEEPAVKKEVVEETIAVTTGPQRVLLLANLASQLLDAWSSLKEAYRIPKREQNQTRREHEREADRKSKEKENDRDRDDDDDRSDYDRYDRRRSPDKDHYRHREKRGYHDSDLAPEHKYKKRIRSVVMLSPGYSPMARMSKEERRHLFELKVQQEEAEEAMRKQHEEYMRQQQEALEADAAAAIEAEAIAALAADPMLGMYYNSEYPPPPEFFTSPRPPIVYPPPPGPIPMPMQVTVTVPMPVPVPVPVNCEPPVPGEEDLSPPLDENGVPFEQPIAYPPPGVVYPPQPQPVYSPVSAPPGVHPTYMGPDGQIPAMYYPIGPPGEEMDSPGRPPPTIIQIPLSDGVSPVLTPIPNWNDGNAPEEVKLAGDEDEEDEEDDEEEDEEEEENDDDKNDDNDEDDDEEEDDDDDDDEEGDDVPVTPVATKLPPGWRSAKDAEGRVYYYHSKLRQPQWEPPPVEDEEGDEEGDGDTPTIDEPKVVKKRSTTTAAADTSSENAKKLKEHFRSKMSLFMVQCLNPYQKRDCKLGRITSKDDFKHLARKLTHFVLAKELKHCRKIEELEISDNVKHKAKDFVRKYMGKFGPVYRKNASPKDDGV